MPEPLNLNPQQQSEILMQALPYMQRYDDAIVVVKYGGHAMGDEEKARDFAKRHGAARAVRHQSGGRARRRAADRHDAGAARHRIAFLDGLRVTDKPTMEIVEMVLSGSINKQIVGSINAEGGRAVGLSGKDGA